MAGGYFPPVSFHFKVTFLGIGNDNDCRFQSVSGLNIDMQTKTIKEGGENRFEHVLPSGTRYSNLILKRGLLVDSGIIEWCMNAFRNLKIEPVDLIIDLLDEKHDPLMSWDVINAWPVKWSVSEMNAEQNSVFIETIELSYNYFKTI